jgi:hypothetical protein
MSFDIKRLRDKHVGFLLGMICFLSVRFSSLVVRCEPSNL